MTAVSRLDEGCVTERHPLYRGLMTKFGRDMNTWQPGLYVQKRRAVKGIQRVDPQDARLYVIAQKPHNGRFHRVWPRRRAEGKNSGGAIAVGGALHDQVALWVTRLIAQNHRLPCC